jgi:glutathione transport system permease protein
MLVYTVRRILAAIPVLLAASIFVFLLVEVSGDPIAELAFQAQTSGEPLSQEAIAQLEQRLYYDRSIPERYWLWLTGLGPNNGDIGLLQGKFGPSVRGADSDIAADLGSRQLITLRLVGFAVILGVALGVVTGVISAVRQYSKTDHFMTFAGFLALAMPVFWFAAIIKEAGIWLNELIGFRLFYTIGEATPVRRGYSGWETFADAAGHLILPTITLALAGYAVFSRFQRDTMLETLNSDYVRLARAKGLRNRLVMRRHALRTSLIPVLTLATLAVAGTIDGVIVVETVFQWNGLGRYFVERLTDTDTFAVMAFLLVSGAFVILANLIADLLYAVLDPRIRYD